MTREERMTLALNIAREQLTDVETITIVEAAEEAGLDNPTEEEISWISKKIANARIEL